MIWFWLLVSAVSTTPTAVAPETRHMNKPALSDDRMLYVVVRDIDLVHDDGSYFPSARHFWVCPKQGVRLEVPDNMQRGLRDLFIFGKCNSWAVFTAKGTGEHSSTNDSTPGEQIRLFGPPEPRAVNELSFGYELEFFRGIGAEKVKPQQIDSVMCDVYQITADSTHLTLYMRQGNGCPYQISIRSPYKQFSIRYDVYERWLPCDSSLFVPPSGIVWKEVKQP